MKKTNLPKEVFVRMDEIYPCYGLTPAETWASINETERAKMGRYELVETFWAEYELHTGDHREHKAKRS